MESVFHSPRVSKMLGQAGASTENPYAGRKKLPPKPLPEMVAAEKRRKAQAAPEPTVHQDAPSTTAEPPVMNGDAETEELAKSIASEAEVQSTFISVASPYLTFPRSPQQYKLLHQKQSTRCTNHESLLHDSDGSGSTVAWQQAWLLVPLAKAFVDLLAAEATAA